MIEAGGGTGGDAMFMAEQLNHTNSEIVYLDFSAASTKITQRRARARGLKNIAFVKDSIESVRYLGLGLFDILNSSGVLHHLNSPIFGLKILKDVLVEGGNMLLMLYSMYGRTAVYQMQHVLKSINDELSGQIQSELSNSKHILAKLPRTNWFEMTAKHFGIGDHKAGEIGIYDLLLHKRDVSFNFPSLFQWLKKAGIHFIDFQIQEERYLLKLKHVLSDDNMKRKLVKLENSDKYHISELLQGKIIKHSFYSSKQNTLTSHNFDESNVMYVYGNPKGLREAIHSNMNYRQFSDDIYFIAQLSQKFVIPDQTNFKMLPSNDISAKNKPLIISFKCNNFTHLLLDSLASSNKGVKLKKIFSEYKKVSNDLNIMAQSLSMFQEFNNDIKDLDLFLIKKE